MNKMSAGKRLACLMLVVLLAVEVTLGEVTSRDDNTTFVLVHGFGFGAWAWFEVVSILKQKGYGAVALDMAAAGIDPSDANHVTTLEQMAKPLLDYVSNFSGPGKLTLVGHSFGGFLISMAMEAHPEKVSIAVYVAAVMPLDQDTYKSTIPPSIPVVNNDSVLIFGDPTSPIPTSGYLKKDKVQENILNETPYKYVVLTLSLTRPTPFRPLLERTSLSRERYGSVARVYVRTLKDNSVTLQWQDFQLIRNPTGVIAVFNLSHSDHAAFFSAPRPLTRLLIKSHGLAT